MFVNFASKSKQIEGNWFHICLILEVKFGDDLLSTFCRFKQIYRVRLLQEEATEIDC